MTCQERILSEDFINIITDFDLSEELRREGEFDYCSVKIGSRLNTTYFKREELKRLKESSFVYQYIPKCYGLMQETTRFNSKNFDPLSLIQSGILKVQNPPLELTGEGVILAFLDTGIRYQDPVFRKADGTSRILAIWDQTIQDGIVPAGFLYGSEYKKEEIDRALLSDRPLEIVPSTDRNGHGTAMASVAAGSKIDYGRSFLGAAPDADILVVKLKEAKQYLRDFFLIPEDAVAYGETDILFALMYLDSFAEIFKKPIVICFGLGTNMGDHTGSGNLALYMDELSTKRNRAIVVCGGNEGNAFHHFTGRYCPEDGRTYKDVEIVVNEKNQGFLTELWGNIPEIFSIQIRSPGGEVLPATKVGVGTDYIYSFVYEKTTITVNFLLVEESSGSELMMIRFRKPTLGIWMIRVIGKGACIGLNFDMWLPIKKFLYSDTYFLKPTPNTTLTVPAYARRVIATSTYNDENGSFWIESGRGFGRRATIVPDISAPGVNVSTIQGSQTGSSLSAAITAGAVAQFMQWAVVEQNDVLVSGTDIKNYFILGATREEGIEFPSKEWGFGKLNIEQVFERLAEV